MFERSINHSYQDPVDLIWLKAAADLGLKIARSADAFAAYDGNGTLTIATAEHFDADDCLAQMIFHEICHWMIAGRRGFQLEDWGLSSIDDSDIVYEYAAIRLQAALSRPYGLRSFMAVTTDWRPYWESLPEDPLGDGDDPAIPLAQDGHFMSRLEPFEAVLKRALSATATIADAVRGATEPSSLWSITKPRHRLGSLLSESDSLKCGTCAWASSDDDAGSILGCRQHKEFEQPAPAVKRDEHACEKWEPKFTIEDCGSCGACCREGFDILTVTDDDPFKRLHPELVQLRDDGEHGVPRPDGLCVALDGDGEASPYRCRHYDSRPRNCRDFEVGEDGCLLARRRVGLSR
ncbi:YkgJ family cysteine cluster protein [Mariniblastus fucicola]|nr:YkgJ family cysteine cluster protein [Mariniblastus fucicola]